MQVSVAKSSMKKSKSIAPNLKANIGDTIAFAQNAPKVKTKSFSLLKDFFTKIFNKNLSEQTIIDKFGKKSIAKYKKGELVEKTLFNNKDGKEFPQFLLKYKNGQIIESIGLRQDGNKDFKRKYDLKTGKLAKEVFYGSDGKTPVGDRL